MARARIENLGFFIFIFALNMFWAGACGVACIRSDTRSQRHRVEVRHLHNALALHRLNHGAFPTTQEGLDVLVRDKELESPAIDLWGRPYHYVSDGGWFRVETYGADGKPGGTDADADVGVDSSDLMPSAPHEAQ